MPTTHRVKTSHAAITHLLQSHIPNHIQVGVLCDADVCTASGLGGTCIAGLNATTRGDDEARRGYRNVTGLFYSSLGSTRGGEFYTNRSAPIIGKLAPALGNLTRLRVRVCAV